MIRFWQKNWLFGCLLIIFFVAYTYLTLTLHYRFNTTDADLAIYDQHVWFLSKGDFLGYGGTFKPFNIFGDHLILHFFWIASFYKIWDSSTVLIIIQNLAIVGSAIPLYLIAKESWKDLVAILFFVASYLLFYGFQAASIFPFHGTTLSVFFISWLLFFMYKKQWKLFFLFLTLSLAAKEDVATFTFFIGLYLIFIQRNLKIGIITSLLSVAWFYLSIFKIMPFFAAGRPYAYFVESQNQKLLNPVRLTAEMFFPWVKTRTLLSLFGSFGFLPLFAPFQVALAAPFLVARFTSTTIQRWLPWMHYSTNQAPILGFAAIFGLVNLYTVLKKFNVFQFLAVSRANFYRCITISTLIITIAIGLYYKMPLYKLLDTSFYKQPEGIAAIKGALTKIPKDGEISVATQSGLLPHLSHRKKIYMYPHPAYSNPPIGEDLGDDASIEKYAIPDVDYIILSKYAFHWRPTNTRFDEVISFIKKQVGYKVIFEKEGTLVVKKV